jgi:hypothetical protein
VKSFFRTEQSAHGGNHEGDATMGKDVVNITLKKDHWEGLRRFAAQQTARHGNRIPTILVLRDAIRVFLSLEIQEINRLLGRERYRCADNTLSSGY